MSSLNLFSLLFVYCANSFFTKCNDLPNANITLFKAVGKESTPGGGEHRAVLPDLPTGS